MFIQISFEKTWKIICTLEYHKLEIKEIFSMFCSSKIHLLYQNKQNRRIDRGMTSV